MTTLLVTLAGRPLSVEVNRDPPLGWRFWTFAGFPGDPIEPRPYGGSRGVPLAALCIGGVDRWLTAMELDGTAQLFTAHELFPCGEQTGVAEFIQAWIERRLEQPRLFHDEAPAC